MSGIDYEELEQTLAALGLGRQSYRALMLLPLVYVAWADGKMERVEVDRIRELARERLHLSQETANTLDQWLRESPSQRYVENGLRGLLGVALDRRELRSGARRVAGSAPPRRSDRARLRRPSTIPARSLPKKKWRARRDRAAARGRRRLDVERGPRRGAFAALAEHDLRPVSDPACSRRTFLTFASPSHHQLSHRAAPPLPFVEVSSA